MGDTLFELEQVLRSRKVQLTLQEKNILMEWRHQSLRDLTIGFGSGSIVSWLATRRLRNLFRINIALGAGATCGMWRFGKSVQSSAEHILSLEGSQLQKELANIMLKRHQDNPWAVKHLSKHFYSEEVYDDSSVDRSTLRWRYRNFSGEPISHSHQTESYGEETQTSDSKEKEVKKTTFQPKQVHVKEKENSVGNTAESSFDLVFGSSEALENAPKPVEVVEVDVLSRKQRRKEKRSKRRQGKRHHQEDNEI